MPTILTRRPVLVLVLVIIVVLACLTITFTVKAGASGRGIPVAGTFICERTAYQWTGQAEQVHKYDPYVYCNETEERTARKAIQCPSCRAWVLPPLPKPDKPFEEMTREEHDAWDRARVDMLARAMCPHCGDPLAPWVVVGEPGRYRGAEERPTDPYGPDPRRIAPRVGGRFRERTTSGRGRTSPLTRPLEDRQRSTGELRDPNEGSEVRQGEDGKSGPKRRVTDPYDRRPRRRRQRTDRADLTDPYDREERKQRQSSAPETTPYRR